MYELIQAGERTYYIDCPTKIGIYVEDKDHVWLIDSGNSRDMGKRIDKILKDNQWQLEGLINTHSHADHIGGNCLLQERYGCHIYAAPQERFFVEHPEFNAMYIYGGHPLKELKNRFLYAQPSICQNVYEANLPKGLEIISLPGHSMEMIGVKTDDGICFLGDAIASENTINKYHITFLYDVAIYLETLDKISTLECNLLIPAHGEVSDPKNLKQVLIQNQKKIEEICQLILMLCQKPMSFDILLQKIFQHYDLHMDHNQWILVGFTVKAFLTYLKNLGLIELEFQDSLGLWHTK